MKLLKFPAFLIACLLYSCEQIDVPDKVEALETDDFGMISINEAVDLAIKATVIGESNKGRSHKTRTISNRFRQVIKRNHFNPRGNITGGYYIVSFDNDEGFAIISTTSLSNPIIGFIPDGKYEDYEKK